MTLGELKLARRGAQRLGDLLTLAAELLGALRELALLTLGALAIELEAAALVAQLARATLVLLERLARARHRLARTLLARSCAT